MSVLMKQLPPPDGVSLMGLEKENLSAFPGCVTVMEIPVNNSGKFSIGLDGDLNKELRTEFEAYFGVQFDTPEGQEFLSQYTIELNHDMMVFNPKTMPDKFTLHVLKANKGLGLIAMNSQDADNSPINSFRFMLTDEEQTREERVGKKQTKVEAFEELGKLNKGTGKRMITLARFIFPTGSGVNSKIDAFDKLEEYVSESPTNAAKFLDIVKLDVEYVDTVVKIKDALRTGIIRQGPDGHFILHASGTKMGRTEDEVILFCMKPSNKEFVGTGGKDDAPYSISYQLKTFEI